MTTPPSIFTVPSNNSTPRGGSLGDPLFKSTGRPFIPPANRDFTSNAPGKIPAPVVGEEYYKRNKFPPSPLDNQITPYSSPPKVTRLLEPYYTHPPQKAPAINVSTITSSPSVATLNRGVPNPILTKEDPTPIDPRFSNYNGRSSSTPAAIKVDDTGLVYTFFNNLGTWQGSVPLQHFWVVKFNFTADFKSTLRKWATNIFETNNEGVPWNYNIDTIMRILNDDFQGISIAKAPQLYTGCYFARSISIPGERVDTLNPSIPAAGGMYFNNILNKRQTPSNLQISFMETNASFVDLFIRPWSILSSYTGSIGRNTTSNNNNSTLKVDVEATFYAKSQYVDNTSNGNIKTSHIKSSLKPYELKSVKSLTDDTNNILPVPRKKFLFKSVQPLSINNQEYTYTGESLQIRPVDFIYKSYTVDTYGN